MIRHSWYKLDMFDEYASSITYVVTLKWVPKVDIVGWRSKTQLPCERDFQVKETCNCWGADF